MSTIIKSRAILVAILLCVTFFAKSQNAEKANSKNSISFKFSNYSVDMDQRLADMLEEIKGVKVVFSCVQVGLLVVESQDMAGLALKEKITTMFEENNEKVKFDIIEAYTANNSGTNNSSGF